VDCYGQAASPEKREKVMKQIDVLTSAVRGIIAAGIPNVPLEIVVALAKEVGPHTVQANFQNGQMKSARIWFPDDRVGMEFEKEVVNLASLGRNA
jgi:hypothetical protein